MNLTHNINSRQYSQFENFCYWLGRGYSIKKAFKMRRLS